MKQTLKNEVLLPLAIIHFGAIVLISIILVMVPSSPVLALLLLIGSFSTVIGTVMLWHFVNSEINSIKKCHDAVQSGSVSDWLVDRTDELGDLEKDILALANK